MNEPTEQQILIAHQMYFMATLYYRAIINNG